MTVFNFAGAYFQTWIAHMEINFWKPNLSVKKYPDCGIVYTFNWLEKNVCIYNGFEANLVLDDSRSLDSRFDQGLQVPQWSDNI